MAAPRCAEQPHDSTFDLSRACVADCCRCAVRARRGRWHRHCHGVRDCGRHDGLRVAAGLRSRFGELSGGGIRPGCRVRNPGYGEARAIAERRCHCRHAIARSRRVVSRVESDFRCEPFLVHARRSEPHEARRDPHYPAARFDGGRPCPGSRAGERVQRCLRACRNCGERISRRNACAVRRCGVVGRKRGRARGAPRSKRCGWGGGVAERRQRAGRAGGASGRRAASERCGAGKHSGGADRGRRSRLDWGYSAGADRSGGVRGIGGWRERVSCVHARSRIDGSSRDGAG